MGSAGHATKAQKHTIDNMKYEFLLFDADNTLLDFDENERQSILKTFTNFGIPCTDSTISMYHEINIMYWDMLAQGKIKRDDLLVKRFETLFERVGITADAVETENFYRNQLGQGSQLIDGAIDLLKSLRSNYKLYIITNGVAETQHLRLEKSGIAALIDGVFISDEIGYNKPAPQFFEYVSKSIPNFDRTKALVVGDGVLSDIKGGIDFGIDTCWLDIYGRGTPDKSGEIRPTYTIRKITDLPSILV